MHFRRVLADGNPDIPKRGDRVIYDQRAGTLQLYRDDAALSFSTDAQRDAAERVFVGLNWSEALTRATAEMYARYGNLEGRVGKVEGSFPSLLTWEVLA